MGASVDAYCERLGPGFWAEPWNALTNLAFLIAAAGVFWMLRPRARPSGESAPASLLGLGVLLCCIALGSFAFHSFALAWTGLLDVIPIAVFELWFVVTFLHWCYGLRWPPALLGVPAYLLLAVIVAVIGGGGTGASYLPALLGMAIFALALARSRDARRRRLYPHFAAAAVVFAVSLMLRTIDGPLCEVWPLGTHIGWHVLNAVVLFTVSRAVILRWREVVATGTRMVT